MSILIAQYKYYSYDNFNHTISGWSVFTMGWIGVAILGLTIGIVANAVGAHGRRQTTINLIAGLFGVLGGQLTFGWFGPTVAGMTLLPVVSGAMILIVIGTVAAQALQPQ
jgi:uncharacterized membrane protein YeaQ/YmgE (transglycosylase-associated protein family)